jgi:Flp pilus assembly pilin Flp
MHKLFVKLWNDDGGVVALEYLLLTTIVGLGLVVGFAALEGAYNAEYTELANAVGSLSQGYFYDSQFNCLAGKQGSAAFDRPERIRFHKSTRAVEVSNINVEICP